MKILIVLISLLTSVTVQSQDMAGDVIASIKAGDSKSICKYFNDNVDLKVIAQEDIYSKAQAELIIKDFFNKHTPKTYIVAHKSTAKAGAEYTIGTLDTTNGKYRVYFLIKKVGDKMVVQQFRIEPENE